MVRGGGEEATNHGRYPVVSVSGQAVFSRSRIAPVAGLFLALVSFLFFRLRQPEFLIGWGLVGLFRRRCVCFVCVEVLLPACIVVVIQAVFACVFFFCDIYCTYFTALSMMKESLNFTYEAWWDIFGCWLF